MAKDTSNEDEDKFEKMDEDSLSFLEQVRKGKSRNFVLSMKGNKVRSMIVKKKPIKEKDRKAAKGEGFQPVYGIVTGMGAKISFAVARSDGFDEKSADRKTEKLKKFLSDQTGKVFKPTFELVDTPPPIPFDDEDLSDPLIAKFMKMEPVIVKACDAHPDRVNEIQQTVSEIRGLLQDEETRQQAGPRINDFVQFLKDMLAGNAPATGAAPPPPPPPPQSTVTGDSAALAKKLAEALKRLKPLVDKVINADPNRKGELHATMTQIAGEIKAKQFDQAKQNVTDFATLLKSLSAQQAAPSTSAAVDRSIEFAERANSLEPRLHEAQSADREKATKLGAVWDYAQQQAQAKNFDKAFTALDRLETAIEGITATRATDEETEAAATMSIMKLGKARLEWRDTLRNARNEMSRLKSALTEAYADAPEMQGEISSALTKLDTVFTTLNETLYDQLDEVLNESDAGRRNELSKQAANTLRAFASFAESDPVMAALDGNEILPDTQITAPILASLNEIAVAIG